MAVDLSEYKEAIANAYEGRAVRDAIVAMVQAVEDALNSDSSGLETRLTNVENTVSGPSGITTQLGTLNSVDEQLMLADQALSNRITALGG